MTTKVTCVICPVGCEIEVDSENKRVLDVRGNKCPRGAKYASAEVVCPERILTSTVAITGGDSVRLPVRSEKPVPKASLFRCINEIRSVKAVSPIKMGDVIISNVAGTGINIIASKNG